MNITTTFIVFRDKETGSFLEDFKSKPGTIAWESNRIKGGLEYAAKIPLEYYEDQKDSLKAMAEALGCEIIKVEADFKLSYPNGSEVKEIKKEKDDIKGFADFLEDIVKGLEGNSDD